ncbi:Wzy polymerase domain-containing protein [Thalassotalea sp. PLHSN55]|uniref:PglL family O-oligosaccharyltransferase n=1 Tax=Thalassotalea sp. PLHSN55 TaxID=3435888 RepID=UPI003F85CC17
MSLYSTFKVFLCLYFLVGMHIIFDTPGGVGLYLSFNTIAWLFVVVLISLGLWQISQNRKVYYSKMLIWIAVGYICLVIPAFYPFEFTDHAIPRLLALTAGLLFLFCLYQFKVSQQDTFTLLLIILIAVAIEAVFGLIQFLILEEGDWGGYKIGISRPHGVFLQPNVMASFMATGLAIALYLSVNLAKFKQQKLLSYFILFSLISTSFLLVLLQSRTGQLAAFTLLILMSGYLYQKNKRQLMVNTLAISCAVIVGIVTLTSSILPQRGSDIYQSAGARSEIYAVGLDMIKTKPIIGFGYGGFERSFVDHFNLYAKQHPNEVGNTIERLSHPHNEVLFWLIEGGVVALLGILCFAIGYLLVLTKLATHKALALAALILPIFLHSLLEFPFYSSVSHWLIFIIMLWLADNSANGKTNINSQQERGFATWPWLSCEKTFVIRFFAVLSPVIFVPFLLTTIHTANILVEHEKSGFQDVEKLEHIVNPIAWQGRLEAAVYAHILIAAVQEKDPSKLESYIEWGLKRIRHKPRVNIYKNLLMAMAVLDQHQNYKTLLIEAKNTFPHIEKWS